MAPGLKKFLVVLFLGILIAAGILVFPKIQNYFYRQKINLENEKTIREIEKIKENIKEDDKEKTITKDANDKKSTIKNLVLSEEITESAYLKVPFICQAPLQTETNWKLHEESCEEAALLQAYLYETNQQMSKEKANEVILNMIDWQKTNLGSHHDLYAEEMKKFIIGYYKLDESEVKIIKDASIEDLKKQIVAGHPIIVPITGDILNNPYYPYPGYHMLTVIGYTKDRIITNDNGTRRGADFSYDTKIFEKAMLDSGADVLILNMKP